jgi:F-type H+-transporting ATPase subunit b
MGDMLHAMGGLLLRALPTFFLVIALNFFLKFFFFRPLEKTLRERYDATGGARKLAGESAERAASRIAEYEAAVRAARAEAYQAQGTQHRQFLERRAAELAGARKRAGAAVEEAKALLAGDAEAAKTTLARDAESLSGQIAASILGRSAA